LTVTDTSTPTTDTTDTGADTDPADEVAKWKTMARKHEAAARANADAAAKLAKYEEAQKSEADKAADRLAKAEARAVEAEAKALRREIALEHKLSSEDAGLLDNVTDETAMRALAARLAGVEAAKEAADAASKKNGNVVPKEGSTSTPPANELRELTRELFKPR
jgi:hypothetical protein